MAAKPVAEVSSLDFFEDEYGQSIASNQRALEIYEKTGDRMGQAAALKGLEMTWMFTDDYTRSLEASTRSADLFEEVG